MAAQQARESAENRERQSLDRKANGGRSTGTKPNLVNAVFERKSLADLLRLPDRVGSKLVRRFWIRLFTTSLDTALEL